MKKINWLIFLALLLKVIPGFSQDYGNVYEFPIKPGTEAWKEFKTGQEMKDACQIPAHILKTMSTEALVNTYLNYPLLSTIYAYNSIQIGFEKITQDFNGLQELLRRNDALGSTLKIYKQIDANVIDKTWTAEQKGGFSFKFSYLEILMAQPELLRNLTLEERKNLVEESLNKFKAKDENPDIFGGFGLLTSALVMGRVIEEKDLPATLQTTAETTKSPMKIFLDNAIVQDTQVINQIVIDAQSYLRR
ncbi:MAG: hypothetical protein HC880_00710 [Bacteroidia bacterium]|nr:hypothetical protein [Bacteroidia bacterium]